jgi:hypothetical protein
MKHQLVTMKILERPQDFFLRHVCVSMLSRTMNSEVQLVDAAARSRPTEDMVQLTARS